MITPSVVLALAVVALGFSAPAPHRDDQHAPRVAHVLRRVYPVVAFVSMASELLACVWSTIAVNQLIENEAPLTTSLWHLLSETYALPWAAVNTHFVLGMFGFLVLVGIKLYFVCGQGGMAMSVVGVVASVLFFMISVVNRSIASSGLRKADYPDNVTSLASQYVSLFIERAVQYESYGVMEVTSVAVMIVSGLATAGYILEACNEPIKVASPYTSPYSSPYSRNKK